MTSSPEPGGISRWLLRAATRILGRDAEWVVGDLLERERRRRSRGQSSVRRLVRDVASTVLWGFAKRIGGGWKMGFSGWLGDVSFALRSLRRRPAYAAGVALTLGLGIGTVAAAFTIVDGVVIRPLPFPESDRLLRVYRTDDRGARDLDFSWPQVDALTRTAAAEDGMGAFSRAGRILRADGYRDGQPRAVGFARVTPGFLETLGASPRLGRLFEPAELRDGAPVVVLGEELWRTMFAADPRVLGATVRLDEVLHTIVGVLPARSGFPEDAELWRPLTADERADDDPELILVARIPDGVSLEAFDQVLGTAVGAARSNDSDLWDGSGARAIELQDALLGGTLRRALLVLLAGAALVLLVAITNAAGLQRLRAVEARRDASVRIALGGSMQRVVRGLLAESLLLAVAGAAIGLALGALALPTLRGIAPEAVPRLSSVELDLRIVLVIALVATLGAIVSAVGPAVSTIRGSSTVIRQHTGVVGGGSRLRTLRTLVAVQLGLTTVLVISAGLLSESLRKLLDIPRGFEPEQLLSVPLALSSATWETEGGLNDFQEMLLARVGALPGVTAVAVANQPPGMSEGMRLAMIGVADLPVPPSENRPGYLHTVSPSYFQTTGLTILEGRPLPLARETSGYDPAVVNETFARAFLGPEPWVGKRFTRAGPGGAGRVVVEVVGVSADVIAIPGEAPPPILYVSTEAVPIFKELLVRVSRTAPSDVTVGLIHDQVLALDPEQPSNVSEWVVDSLGRYGARTRFHARLMTMFGVLALLLAAVGVYGVAAYGASLRRAELGLRRALGAPRGGVLALVLVRALGTALPGIFCGALGAWGVSRLLESLLFEVSPFDPAIYILCGIGLGAVALLAGLPPAVRASRDDASLSRLLREG
jgi:putative ABC transport system permease protein